MFFTLPSITHMCKVGSYIALLIKILMVFILDQNRLLVMKLSTTEH